jgi:hypothetical protein
LCVRGRCTPTGAPGQRTDREPTRVVAPRIDIAIMLAATSRVAKSPCQ